MYIHYVVAGKYMSINMDSFGMVFWIYEHFYIKRFIKLSYLFLIAYWLLFSAKSLDATSRKALF